MWKDLQENQDVFGSATPHSTHRQVTSPGDVGLGVLQNILQDSYLRRHRMGSEQRTPTTILIIHSLYPIEKRVRVTQDTGFKHLRAFVLTKMGDLSGFEWSRTPVKWRWMRSTIPPHHHEAALCLAIQTRRYQRCSESYQPAMDQSWSRSSSSCRNHSELRDSTYRVLSL